MDRREERANQSAFPSKSLLFLALLGYALGIHVLFIWILPILKFSENQISSPRRSVSIRTRPFSKRLSLAKETPVKFQLIPPNLQEKPKKQVLNKNKVKVEKPVIPVPKQLPSKPEVEPSKELPVHQKMVDQDEFPDDKDNPNAHFLAQKNHQTSKEMQAKNPSAEKSTHPQKVEPAASAPVDGQVKEEQENSKTQHTEASKTKIPVPSSSSAHSLARKQMAKSRTSSSKAQLQAKSNPSPLSDSSVPSPLAMRLPKPKGDPKLSESKEPSAIAKTESEESQKQAQKEEQKKKEGHAQFGEKRSLNLFPKSSSDYDRIVGEKKAEEERESARQMARLGQNEKGSPSAQWEKRYRQRVEAALGFTNNHIPNMQVGNENDLGTRKHPFAAYLAGVHRRIHTKWGDGFLATLDAHGDSTYPMNLGTQIALIINADGTLCKHRVARTSGNSSFDVAAWESVRTAAPFAPPPDSIKSPDGRVYVIWSFFRDERQCATDFVHAQIVTKTLDEPCESL